MNRTEITTEKHTTEKLTADEKQSAISLIALAYEEDLRDAGDLTSQALLSYDDIAEVTLVSRDEGVLAGLLVAELAFQKLWERVSQDHSNAPKPIEFQAHISDGDSLESQTKIATVKGPLPLLLTAERTALNFLTHLSGIASLTSQFVKRANNPKVQLLDTRKTHPGYRLLEKYAVRCGGGTNHRIGLFDAMMIKDNHVAAWKRFHQVESASLQAAVEFARKKFPDVPLQIEVDTLEQLDDALRGNPDYILLDNMSIEQLQRSVSIRDAQQPSVLLEASGGVNLDTIEAIAKTGVERISVGALTHSAIAHDIGFDWKTSST